MTDRFIRDYELVIGIGARAVTIKPPFRIAFSADKSDDATVTRATTSLSTLKLVIRARLKLSFEALLISLAARAKGPSL